MATDETSTPSSITTTPPGKRPRRIHNVRMVQNFHLVWLDKSTDEIDNDECHNSIMKLQQVVHTVNAFVDADECIDFITDIKEKAFIVLSGQCNQTIIQVIQDIPQVDYIYIYCENNMPYEKKANEWLKVKGVFTHITAICEALKQAVQDYDHNSTSISFIQTTGASANRNIDQLDQSFMYTQILKEILLTINFEQVHFDEFIAYCHEQFIGNPEQIKIVDMIQQEFYCYNPIRWYTYPCFLYSMLNTALRAMEVDLIIKMGFFVRALYNEIDALHKQQFGGRNHSDSFTVYRGQGLTPVDFDQLKNTQGGLLSFNNFLSTSLDRAVSFAFAESSHYNPNLIGVLFEITINPSIASSSFANVNDTSSFNEEEEILFSMHSVFRVGQIKQISNNDRLWHVDLILTSDHDPDLEALTKSIQQETKGSTGWFRLGRLLMTVAQYDKAHQVFDVILAQTTNENEKGELYYYLGWIKSDQGQHTEALSYYEKALEIKQKTLPIDHPSLATFYNNIGNVYQDMGEYSRALSHHKKALEISQKTLPADHPDFAQSYNNTGLVYHKMGEYSKALSYHEKALEIRQKTLPADHPDFAQSYNNIGNVYQDMGDYSKALSYYEKALEIFQKTLPANHPSLATSYNNIGTVYQDMGEHSRALSYYEKALEIRQKTLPADHPDFAQSYNNIGTVYQNMGEYSKALSYHEKALEIRQKTPPADHPNLATSYNNIGLLYQNMGEYSKALSYHEKGLEIRQKTLPADHPDMATSYNSIGLVYQSMGEYSKALSCYEKDFEISLKTLPTNHPSLATYYNNIGNMCQDMGEYSKALSYSKKALEIQQKALPTNHPSLGVCYNNIGLVYHSMGEYSKALSCYEKDFEISLKTLSANHPSLGISYNNIASVYDNLGEYSRARSYYEHALDIWQRALPTNHPDIEMVKRNMGIMEKHL